MGRMRRMTLLLAAVLAVTLATATVSALENEGGGGTRSSVYGTAEGTDFIKFDWDAQLAVGAAANADGSQTVYFNNAADYGTRLAYRYPLNLSDTVLDFTIENLVPESCVNLVLNKDRGAYDDSGDFAMRIERNVWGSTPDLDQVSVHIGPGLDYGANYANDVIRAVYQYDANGLNIRITIRENDDGDYAFAFAGEAALLDTPVAGPYPAAKMKEHLSEAEVPQVYCIVNCYTNGKYEAGDAMRVTFHEIADAQFSQAQQEAEDAVALYEQAEPAASATESILSARKVAQSAAAGARVFLQPALSARIAAKDALLLNDAAFCAAVHEILEGQIARFEAAALSLNTDAGITAENIAAAKAACAAVDASLSTFLTQEEAAAMESRQNAAQYSVSRAEVVLVVLAFENAVAECAEQTTAAGVLAAEALQAEAEELDLLGLNAEDAAAVAGRIANAADLLAGYKAGIADQFAGYYLDLYEEAAAAVDLAKVQLTDVTRNLLTSANAAKRLVVFDESHPDYEALSVRYEAANAILEETQKAYFSKELEAANAILADAEKAKDLQQFAVAQDTLDWVDLSLLGEEGAEYDALEASYRALEAAITASKLNGFANNGMNGATLTEKGVQSAGLGKYPNRLNYNMPVDMTDAKMAVSVDEYAFYNRDDDDPDRGANNLAFSFLSAPNSYKGIDHGFTVMVWVFEAQCNVQVYDYNDSPISSCEIATPAPGGNFIIRIALTEQYWVVKVNEGEMVLGNTALIGIDKEIFKDGANYKGYFSVGSFTTNNDGVNTFTVKQVGDTLFGDETFTFPDIEEEPEDPVVTPPPSGQPADPSGGLTTGAIVGICVGGAVLLLAVGFALYWFVFRKKKQ